MTAHLSDSPSPALAVARRRERPATSPPVSARNRIRACYATVALGVLAYLIGFLPALRNDDYQATLLPHLTIRAVGATVALVLLVIGVVLNKPKEKLPWVLIGIWIASCTLRALLLHLNLMDRLDGWVVFAVVAIQRLSDAAAIVAVVRLRRPGRLTDVRHEVAIVMLAYVGISIPFVVLPSWGLYGAIPYSLAFAVLSPLTYLISTALVAQLIFIDILARPAARLLALAWSLEIIADVVSFAMVELSGSAIGTAAFDVLGIAPFLAAAAALHPSMTSVTRPVEAVRGDWSGVRTAAVVLAAAAPLVVLMSVGGASDFQRAFVGIFGAGILLLLVVRVRRAVSAAVDSSEQLRLQSRTDPLTGLLNRRGLVEQTVGERGPIGVAFVDLDRFKLFNDVHGHAQGDHLLAEVAARLGSLGPPVLSVARVGGDEFALVFDDEAPDAAYAAERTIATAFRDRFLESSPTPIWVTASCGLAVESCTADLVDRNGMAAPSRPGRDAAAEWGADGGPVDHDLLELVRQADIAQYYAKAAGGGLTCTYDSSMHEERARQERILDLLKAIEDDCHFSIHYQAIVEIETGRVVGAEALARLFCDDVGVISPAEFIPTAEQHGFIATLGDWVFESVADELDEFAAGLPAGFCIAVNVSPLQLRSDAFVDHARRLAARRPGTVERLRIEVTESAILDEASVARIHQLRQIGFGISIDDFGSGYASPQHLIHVPLDVLKLDRLFTSQVRDDARSRIVVAHVIQMTLEMGAEVLAEGVEHETEREILAAMGCRFGQGYLWDRPAPDLGRIVALAAAPVA